MFEGGGLTRETGDGRGEWEVGGQRGGARALVRERAAPGGSHIHFCGLYSM